MNFLIHRTAEAATRQESTTTSSTSPKRLPDGDAPSTGPEVSSVWILSLQSHLSASKVLEQNPYFSEFPGTTGDACRPAPWGTGS